MTTPQPHQLKELNRLARKMGPKERYAFFAPSGSPDPTGDDLVIAENRMILCGVIPPTHVHLVNCKRCNRRYLGPGQYLYRPALWNHSAKFCCWCHSNFAPEDCF